MSKTQTERLPGNRIFSLNVQFLIVSFIGGAFILLALDGYWGQIRLEVQGELTTGVITERYHATGEDSGNWVSYSYQVGEQTYLKQEDGVYFGQLFSRLQVGDEIQIYYLPDDPETTLIRGNSNNQHELLFVGWLMLLLGMWLFSAGDVHPDWQRTRVEKLLRNVMALTNFGFLGLLLASPSILAEHPSRLGDILLAVLSCIGVGVALFYIPDIWRAFRKTGQRFCFPLLEIPYGGSVTHWPGVLDGGEQKLNRMGFRPWFGAEFQCIEDPESKEGWFLHNADATIVVCVTYTHIPGMAFFSWAGEDYCIHTTYPVGENFTNGHFYSRYSETSIEDTYQLHLATLEEVRQETGALVRFTTSEDYFQYQDKMYDLGYTRRLHRRMRGVFLLQILVRVAFAVYSVGGFIAHRSLGLDEWLLWVVVSTFLMALIYLFPQWQSNWGRTLDKYFIPEKEKKPDTRKKKQPDGKVEAQDPF